MTPRPGPPPLGVVAAALLAWGAAVLLLAPADDAAVAPTPVPDPAPDADPPPGPEAPAPAAGDLVARGDALLSAGDLLEPPEANALDHYRQALALDPGDRAALAGIDAVGRALAERGLEALRAGDLDAARADLGTARELAPGARAVLALAETLATREAAADLVERIRAQLAAGRLTTPEGESAVALVREAFAVEPPPPGAEAARDAVVAKLEAVAADAREFDLDALAAPYEDAARTLAAL